MTGGGAFQNVSAPSLPVVAREPPPEGRMVAPLSLTFTAALGLITQQFQLSAQSMSQVRTLFVDNSANASPLTLIHGVGNLKTIIPAAGGGLVPTQSAQGSYFFTAQTAVAVDTPVQFAYHNYEIPPQLWGTQVVTVQGTIPTGGIMMWSGSVASIPGGWGLCDGTVYQKTDGSGNITSPDLRDKFILGAGGAHAPGATGGSTKILQANLPNYQLPVNEAPHSHTMPNVHTFSGSAGWYTGGVTGGNSQPTDGAVTGLTVNSGGSGQDYFPPYYALAFILKL